MLNIINNKPPLIQTHVEILVPNRPNSLQPDSRHALCIRATEDMVFLVSHEPEMLKLAQSTFAVFHVVGRSFQVRLL